MKVVKHCRCVWYWCECPLYWVYSLNHRTMPPYASQEVNRSLRRIQGLAGWSSGNMVRIDTYAHSQHGKVVKHFICIWYWCGSLVELVYSLNHRTLLWFASQEVNWSLRKIQSLAGMSSCNMVRIDTCEHPQHGSVVKYITCDWY